MKTKHKEIVIFLGSVVIVLLQIWARSWEFRFTQEMQVLNYGTAMLFPAVIQTLINITSGLLLIFLVLQIGLGFSIGLYPKPLQPVLLGFLPLLSVILKLLFSLGINIFSLGQLLLAEWIWITAVPGLWLGISLGWLFSKPN